MDRLEKERKAFVICSLPHVQWFFISTVYFEGSISASRGGALYCAENLIRFTESELFHMRTGGFQH